MLLEIPLALALSFCVQDGEPVFEQELARIEVKMADGNWDSARIQLRNVLESHAHESYVLGHLGEIELALKRCSFWGAREDAGVNSFFQSELLSYDPGQGRIKLRSKEGEQHDFVQLGSALVHKVEFDGPYSIEIEHSQARPMLVCATPQSSVQVSFSETGEANKKTTGRRVTIYSTLPDRSGKAVNKESSKDFTSGALSDSYKTKVYVTQSSISASFDGRKQFSIPKPRDLWGQVALGLGDLMGTVVVEGVAKQWIQKERDKLFRAGWPELERDWKLDDHLPIWMAGALKKSTRAAPRASLAGGVALLELSQTLLPVWNAAVAAMNKGDYKMVLANTAQLLASEPDLADAAYLRAQAFNALRRRPEAILALTRCSSHSPAHLLGMKYLARLYLVSGQFEKVLDTVAQAVAAGTAPGEFQSIAVTASKAIHGPIWNEKHSHSTRHYQVSSDISEERCREVAIELEEAFQHISRRMGRTPRASGSKFQVFVFAGQASYLDYIAQVFEGRGEFTQGMYSPFLKQLLVLDSGSRETFFHTVRHECFHQYFDAILDEPPIWLNEGLAEYYASARSSAGNWRDGRVNEYRLEHLKASPNLKPLSSFLHIESDAFMQDGANNYAQSWGLVHYLRHSSVANKARYDRLMKGLLGDSSNQEAIDAAFSLSELKTIDRQLAAYIQKL